MEKNKKCAQLGRGPVETAAKKEAFLQAYAATANISEASRIVGITYSTPYQWFKKDPKFSDAFADVREQAAQRLEDEAVSRATVGVDEPVFFQGEIVGHVNKRSDSLLMFLLKGWMPGKYRDRLSTEISGPNGGPIQSIDLGKLSDSELDVFTKICQKAMAPDKKEDDD